MTDTIFWYCGTQRDLADLDGKLYVPGTESIRPRLRRLAETARERNIPRLCTVVAHRDGDPDITCESTGYPSPAEVHMHDARGHRGREEKVGLSAAASACRAAGSRPPQTIPRRWP